MVWNPVAHDSVRLSSLSIERFEACKRFNVTKKTSTSGVNHFKSSLSYRWLCAARPSIQPTGPCLSVDLTALLGILSITAFTKDHLVMISSSSKTKCGTARKRYTYTGRLRRLSVLAAPEFFSHLAATVTVILRSPCRIRLVFSSFTTVNHLSLASCQTAYKRIPARDLALPFEKL